MSKNNIFFVIRSEGKRKAVRHRLGQHWDWSYKNGPKCIADTFGPRQNPCKQNNKFYLPINYSAIHSSLRNIVLQLLDLCAKDYR